MSEMSSIQQPFHLMTESYKSLVETTQLNSSTTDVVNRNGDNSLSVSYDTVGLTDSSEHLSNPAVSGVEEDPVIDIIISNVVCSFNTKCHLNLKRVATEGMNVIYKREQGMVSMKIRSSKHPNITASIWSSGKITCTGATSEEQAKVAARKVARCLQRIGFKVRFTNFRVVNVLGTCSLPFSIRINQFSRSHPAEASYEPELHPGVTYRLKSPKATLKIFSTGSITVTAPRVSNVQDAIVHIYPLVQEFQMEKAETRNAVDTFAGAAASSFALSAQAARKRKRVAYCGKFKDDSSGEDDDDDYC